MKTQGIGRTDRELLVWISWILLLFAFGLRVCVAYFQPRPNYFWHTDTTAYWGDAESLLREGRLSHGAAPPGLAILLVPFVWMKIPAFQVVLVVQSLLGTLTILLAMRITRYLSNRHAALLCGLILAVYPPLLNLTRQLITETWFILFLVLSVSCLLRDSLLRWFLGGCAAGMACLIRPAALGVVLFTSCAFVSFRPLRSRAPLYLTGVAAFLLFGTALQSHSAGHLVFFGQTSQTATYKPVWGGYATVDEAEAMQRGSYLDFLVRSPKQFVTERVISVGTLLSPWPLGSAERSLSNKLLIAASDLCVYALILWACRRVRRATWKVETWFLVAPVCGLVTFYGLLFSQPRYRWPFMPFLVCIVAVVWGNWKAATSGWPGSLRSEDHSDPR